MEKDDCTVCKHIKESQSFSSEPNGFCLHIDVDIFKKENNTKKKKETKRRAVQNLNKFVTALRNTLGGFILIHLCGQADADLFLGHFDEVIGPKLRELQQDGDLYINTFRRTWEEHNIDGGRINLIRLVVRKSDVICTSSFNTKVCTDHENTDATILDVLSILCSDASSPDKAVEPTLRTIESGAQDLHESRSNQLKRVLDKNLAELGSTPDDPTSFVNYIWHGLKFKNSLTSMSKVVGGGSFYIGVHELKEHLTRTPICEGFNFEFDFEAFQEKLTLKLEDEVSVLTREGRFIDSDIASLKLISVGNYVADDPSKRIVEIAVRYFDGIVFHEKDGPRAYHIKDSKICRIGFQEWYEQMKLLTGH